jgi:hypothetical protein
MTFPVVGVQFNGNFEFAFGRLPIPKVNQVNVTANGMRQRETRIENQRAICRLDRERKYIFRKPEISITKLRITERLAGPGLGIRRIKIRGLLKERQSICQR